MPKRLPSASGANESPQDQLRTIVAANREAFEDWVTLGGHLEHAEGRAAVADALAAAAQGDDAQLPFALEHVLEAGLALRDGMFLGGAHWIFYLQFRQAFGAEPSAHVVCNSCHLVFRPLRKGSPVDRCDRCNTSRAMPPFTSRPHADGHGYSISGLFAGTTHVRTCACCQESFAAKTATTLYCSGACRKAAGEGRSRQRERTSQEMEYEQAVSAANARWVMEALAQALPELRRRRLEGRSPTGREVIEEAKAQARMRNPRSQPSQ